MLNNISWSNYISIILLLLAVYYIIVGAKFYSQEIQDLVRGRKKLSFHSISSAIPVQDEEDPETSVQTMQPELFVSDKKNGSAPDETDDTLDQVRELTQGIRKVIADAVEQNYIKEEFVLSLQLLLKKYAFLKGSPSLAAINNLIASECEKYGYLQLSAEECVILWNE